MMRMKCEMPSRGTITVAKRRVQERPKLNYPDLHDMSHEQVETVPGDCHRDARAKPPRTVTAREHHDGQ